MRRPAAHHQGQEGTTLRQANHLAPSRRHCSRRTPRLGEWRGIRLHARVRAAQSSVWRALSVGAARSTTYGAKHGKASCVSRGFASVTSSARSRPAPRCHDAERRNTGLGAIRSSAWCLASVDGEVLQRSSVACRIRKALAESAADQNRVGRSVCRISLNAGPRAAAGARSEAKPPSELKRSQVTVTGAPTVTRG